MPLLMHNLSAFLTERNPNFAEEALEKLPRNKKLIVACSVGASGPLRTAVLGVYTDNLNIAELCQKGILTSSFVCFIRGDSGYHEDCDVCTPGHGEKGAQLGMDMIFPCSWLDNGWTCCPGEGAAVGRIYIAWHLFGRMPLPLALATGLL